MRSQPAFARARRAASSALLATTVAASCALARAQSTNLDDAAALDAQGTALLNQRRLAEACPKLEQSFEREPGTGVLLRLALCQELSGKGATAFASYLAAAERARAAGDTALVELAQKRASALEKRLSYLTIQLAPSASAAPYLEVSRDGARLDPTTLNAALPIDPGPHVIEASAPGRKRFQDTVLVNEAPSSYSIVITLPLSAEHAESAGSAVRAESTTLMSSGAAWSTQKTLAVASAGVGVAGLTLGTIFGLGVASKMSHARARCAQSPSGSGCPPESLAQQDDARGLARASTAAFVVGGAGLLGGLALWLSAPAERARPSEARFRAYPLVGLGAAGLQADGAW